MDRYCYYFNDYNCHPETCCHEDHYSYSVYKLASLSLGPYKYGPREVLFQSDSKDECEEYLEPFDKNLGLCDPWMRY